MVLGLFGTNVQCTTRSPRGYLSCDREVLEATFLSIVKPFLRQELPTTINQTLILKPCHPALEESVRR